MRVEISGSWPSGKKVKKCLSSLEASSGASHKILAGKLAIPELLRGSTNRPPFFQITPCASAESPSSTSGSDSAAVSSSSSELGAKRSSSDVVASVFFCWALFLGLPRFFLAVFLVRAASCTQSSSSLSLPPSRPPPAASLSESLSAFSPLRAPSKFESES